MSTHAQPACRIQHRWQYSSASTASAPTQLRLDSLLTSDLPADNWTATHTSSPTWQAQQNSEVMTQVSHDSSHITMYTTRFCLGSSHRACRAACESVACELNALFDAPPYAAAELEVAAYHAGMDPSHRARVQVAPLLQTVYK